MPRSPLPLPSLRAACALLAAIAGGWLGLTYGDRLGYALADLVGRDAAELKDTLIWGILTSGAVAALAAAWIALVVTRAAPLARRAALSATAIAALAGAGLMTSAYDWPKASGTPVIDYEIVVPAGIALPAEANEIALIIWSHKSGQGCGITRINREGPRHAFAGTIVLNEGNTEPVLSLQLPGGAKRTWRLPYTIDTALEEGFRPWQTIEFIEGPAPEGLYEIRYRLRRFM